MAKVSKSVAIESILSDMRKLLEDVLVDGEATYAREGKFDIMVPHAGSVSIGIDIDLSEREEL